MPRRSKRKKAKEPEAPPKLSLPRLPCTGAHACGVLMCMHVHEDSAKARGRLWPRAFLRRACCGLSLVRRTQWRWRPPRRRARSSALRTARCGTSTGHRAGQAAARDARGQQGQQGGPWLRPWSTRCCSRRCTSCRRCSTRPTRTVFLDCDLFVLDASLVDGAAHADAAAGRAGDAHRPVARRAVAGGAGAAAVQRARRVPRRRRRRAPAARRGGGAADHRAPSARCPGCPLGTRRSPLVHVLAAPRLRLRVAALPEERCAGELLSSTHVLEGTPPRVVLRPFAHLRTSGGRQGPGPARRVPVPRGARARLHRGPVRAAARPASRRSRAGARAQRRRASREGRAAADAGGRRGWLPDGYLRGVYVHPRSTHCTSCSTVPVTTTNAETICRRVRRVRRVTCGPSRMSTRGQLHKLDRYRAANDGHG